ncbi:MAG: 4Fe-4S dicluster domain-containing protein [Gammaproteobacteria bacterium]|nr:4Fe-4S dicluster domain-containing protein [Gammaproteobacteria bacterium]
MPDDVIAKRFLAAHDFVRLLETLADQDYRCVGPTVRDGAVVYDRLEGVEDLPAGVQVSQGPGSYRVEFNRGTRLFDWANGPQALKPWLFNPREILWEAHRGVTGDLHFSQPALEPEPVAVIGVRACDLAALALQDRHFIETDIPDAGYTARRRRLFLVAVNCTRPADTCFCASTGDGPAATQGYDLVLDELDDGYIVSSGSTRGDEVMDLLPLKPVSPQQQEGATEATERAATLQNRQLPGRNLRDLLFASLDHPHWEAVAARCLSCGNCTSVCPTCFCYRELDQPALDRESARHYREWDSCFTQGHSYIHGFVVRPDTRLRYRQWLTHKLGGWHDQYGRSGCVGCGRCIAWCPVGIDITEEVGAIAVSPA